MDAIDILHEVLPIKTRLEFVVVPLNSATNFNYVLTVTNHVRARISQVMRRATVSYSFYLIIDRYPITTSICHRVGFRVACIIYNIEIIF